MTRIQKIKSFINGVVLLVFAVIMFLHPAEGFYIAAAILSFSLLVNGLRTIIYYFSMARHMVGGKINLYKGIILLDLGLFIFSLDDIPHLFVILYVVIYSLFIGVINVMRSLESRKNQGRWRLKLSLGIFDIITGILCLVMCGNINVVVYIYCIGLVYSACVNIADAFRQTSIIYIQ